jgi:hypothetical protein
MPLARYFLFVGASLLTLLFVVDAYLPKLPAAEPTNVAAADLSVIRIQSDRKWPERVVFDTNVPSIPPAATGTMGAKAPMPASVADVSVREVFAQLPVSNPPQPRPAERKFQPKRRVVARSRISPPMFMVAQQPRMGFFGNGFW